MAKEKKKPAVRVHLNVPDGKPVPAKKALSPAPPEAFGNEGCCVREFWAVVERDGTLIRGRNVWRVKKLPGKGLYEVIFTGDVSNGVYTATIGRPGISTEPCGLIGVALRCCLSSPETNKGVWVNTHNHKCERSDRAFHLVVHTQS